MRTLSTVLLLAFSTSVSAPVFAQSSIGAPSLADVAKKNKEEQRKDGKSSKVYSNDDLRPVPPPAEPPPAPAAATGSTDSTASAGSPQKAETAAAAPASAEKSSTETKDQAWWSKRIAAARAQLERDKVLADALQSRINALTADFTSRDDPAQRGQVAADRQRALTELDAMKKAIVADQKAIPAIEEEARQAGVPAGWLR